MYSILHAPVTPDPAIQIFSSLVSDKHSLYACSSLRVTSQNHTPVTHTDTNMQCSYLR